MTDEAQRASIKAMRAREQIRADGGVNYVGPAKSDCEALIAAAVQSLGHIVYNETAAWNAWNYIASPGPILDAVMALHAEPQTINPLNEYGSTLTGDPAYDAALADWKAAGAQWGQVVTWRDEQSFAAAWRRKPAQASGRVPSDDDDLRVVWDAADYLDSLGSGPLVDRLRALADRIQGQA